MGETYIDFVLPGEKPITGRITLQMLQGQMGAPQTAHSADATQPGGPCIRGWI